MDSNTILPPGASEGATIPAADKTAQAAVSGVLVVVVRTGKDTVRRRVYLSLKAAERAAERAHMAGHAAQIVLAHLVPASGPTTWSDEPKEGTAA